MKTRHHLHLALLAVAILTTSCGGGAANEGGSSAASDQDGAEAVVLVAAGWAGSWPAGLDPATNTTARANLSQMNAIFGGLFQLMPSGPDGNFEITGVLAEGYDIEDDGRSIVIRLRQGIKFSDGT